MSKFLIDENMNQKAVRNVPTSNKGFDIVYPETGGYKGAADSAVQELAEDQQRVLVSQEKDFGQSGLKPEDVPHGAIWLRPGRTSQRQTGGLLAGLCRTLQENCSSNPYDFAGKIVEVYPNRIVVRTAGGAMRSYPVPAPASTN
jgi:predicted nuclease of predicted toxin-antitoxin system